MKLAFISSPERGPVLFLIEAASRLLGTPAAGVGIVSFLLRFGDLYLHPNFVTPADSRGKGKEDE